MKRAIKLISSVLFFTSLIHAEVFAHDEDKISFVTVKGTERATVMLRNLGVRAFMDKAWKQGVSAPGIHSKYWLDQFTRDKPELYAIEKAYRDFGYEVAVQIENLAFEIYEKPDKSLELDRLDWLLRFSKWLLKPGCFENYRIGMRAECAALMPLLRTIFNLDIPTEKIERYMDMFSTTKENAVFQATFLYEESSGAFDVRELAQKAKPGIDKGFESKWNKYAHRAYKHFDNQLLCYTTDSEILQDEKIEYSFFMDDNREIGGWNSVPGRWNEKYHKSVGVFGGHSYAVREFHHVLTFRKDVGDFPDVEVSPEKDGLNAYGNFYFEKFNNLTKASTMKVGWLYWECKNNKFMDDFTISSYESRNCKPLTIEEFESRPSTKMRRARNQQWLKKHRKSK